MEPIELAGRPSVHDLFCYYNLKHFEGKLGAVRVEWSKRLTRSAGLCYFKRRGRAEECFIRLSEALLQFRPFSDTMNTLLHEMIHAFLFVTHSWKDQSDHGPHFCSIMKRINKIEGWSLNLTCNHTCNPHMHPHMQVD
jgi:SprT-like domain-contaning protein Spartan